MLQSQRPFGLLRGFARSRWLSSRVMLLAAAGSAATLLCSQSAMAQSVDVWSGGGADTNWTTAGNWSSGGPPVNTDSLSYVSGVTNLTSTNNDTGLSLTAITFGSGAGAYVLNPLSAGGNAIALTGALADNSANTSTETINFAINGTSTSSLAMSSDTGGFGGIGGTAGPVLALNANDTFGSMAISNNTNSGVADALLIGAGNSVTINGAAMIGINSAGAADTTNFNSYLGAANSANNGTGGTLNINGNLTVGGGNTNGTSTANHTTADLSALSGVNIVGGTTTTTLNASTLSVGTGEHDDGILMLASGSNSVNSINVGTIYVGSSIVGDAGNDNATPGSTLTLGSGANTIEANTLIIGSGKSTGVVNFASTGGSVSIAGTGGVGTTAITISNETVSSANGGTSSLLLAGNNATVQASTVIVANLAGSTANASVATVTFDTGIFNAAALELAVDTIGADAAGPNGTFTLGNLTGGAGVLNVGSTMWLVDLASMSTGARTDSGTLNINSGTANIGGNMVINAITGEVGTANAVLNFNGGTLNMEGNSIGTAARPITTVNLATIGTAVLENLGGTGIYATGGSGAGSGGLNFNDFGTTLILDGNNTYTGGTNITNGTLQVGQASSAVLSSPLGATSGAVTNNSALTFGSNNAMTIGNTIGGGGTVSQNGNGVTTLTASNGYSGNTTINAGTLAINGSLTASNVIISGGTLTGAGGTISNSVTLNSGSLTSGSVPASNSGMLTIGSLTTNGGTLMFDLGGGTNNSISVNSAPSFGITAIAFTLGGAVSNGQVYTLITTPEVSLASGLGGLNMSATSIGRTTFTPGTSGGNLIVTIGGGPAALTWNNLGNAGPDDGTTWDVQTNNNWQSSAISGVATQFYTADNVTFSDNNNGHNLVTIPGQVLPTSVTFTNSSQSYTLSGAGGIAGGTGLLINGGGTVTLQTVNTYSGNTNVFNGTLNLNSGGSISSTNFIIGGGTVNVASTGSIASPTTNLNGGALNINSGGSISSTNLNVDGGTAAVASGGSITGANATVASGAALTVASGGSVPAAWNLTDNGSVTFSSPATTIGTLNGTGVVNLNSDTLTIANGGTVGAVLQDGGVGNPGSLSVSGGTLILTGANLYTGATSISSGATLQIGNGGATGSLSSATIITDAGTLTYDLNVTPAANLAPTVADSGTVIFNSPGVVNADISNITATTGSIQQIGAGTTSITGTTTNFAGKFSVGGGTLVFNYPSPTTISNPITATTITGTIANVGKLTLSGPEALGTNIITYNVAPVSGTMPDGQPADVEITGSVSTTNTVGIIKAGAGTLALSPVADNAALGVTVNSGTVLLNAPSTIAIHAIGGSGLNINSGGVVQIASTATGTHQIYDGGGIVAINSGGTFDLNGQTENVSTLQFGDTTGQGTLTNSAPGTAAVIITGGIPTDTGGGTGAVGGVGMAMGSLGGTVTVPLSSTIEIQNNGGVATANNHTLTAAGPGTVFLTGTADNKSLNVAVSGGTLVLNHNSSGTAHSASIVMGVSAGAFLQLGSNGGNDQIFNGFVATTGTQLDYGVLNMNGTFDLNGQNEAFDKLTGSGTVINSSGITSNLTLGTNNGLGPTASDFTGSIQGNIALLKITNGTATTTPVILSGPNTFSGGTDVAVGVVQIGDGGSNGTLGTGPTEVDDTLAFDRIDNGLVVSGGLNGSGTINQIGTGTTTLASLTDAGGTFNGNINANAGKLVIGGNSITNSGISEVVLNSLTINTGGAMALGNAAATSAPTVNANRTVIVTPTFNMTVDGTTKLDLGSNDMIVQNSGESGYVTLNNAVAAGRGSNGLWTSNGIASSSAGSTKNTALGVILNSSDQTGVSGSQLYSTFDGVGVTQNDVLVKYTYDGDANLDGVVNAADYTQIDNGFNMHLTGWYNGDFNYDGVINGDDYTLIDNAFNTQGSASLAAVSAGPAEMIAGNTDQIAGAASSAVPEPTTLGMIGMGAAGLLLRRRRRAAVR